LPENRKRGGFLNVVLLRKIRQWPKPPKKNIVSGNVSHAAFSLGFPDLEDGTIRVS
jgi:hypothetical protein